MTDNGKGTIMSHPSCELVRPWLPLMVEEEGETISAEGFDQGILDRDQIERHLAACPDCRQYRASLRGAVSILAAVAAEMPAEPVLGSLWPELQQRISRQQARPLSTRLRLWRAICPDSIRSTVDRLRGLYSHLRDELPLQLAWTRDSFHELVDHVIIWRQVKLKSASGLLESRLRTRFHFGFYVAIVGAAALLLVMIAQRPETQYEAEIVFKATPIPASQTEPVASPEYSEDVVISAPVCTATRVRDALALAGPVAPPRASTLGRSIAAQTATTATTSEASAPQYDFDLEHGTPMPPETRPGKPAY